MFVVAKFNAQRVLSADAQHSKVRIPEDLHRREMEKNTPSSYRRRCKEYEMKFQTLDISNIIFKAIKE